MGDLRVRIATFDWLTEKIGQYPDGLPRALLEEGFVFEGTRVAARRASGHLQAEGL